MSYQAGSAFVSIKPDMTGFQDDVKAELATTDAQFAEAGDKAGASFGTAFSAQLKESLADLPDATIKADDLAPGSICPIERSPRNEARPRVASIGIVASAAVAATMGRRAGRSAPPSARAVCTGVRTSSMVFWPGCDLPRALTASTALPKAVGRFEPSGAISLLSARKRVP